MLGPRETKTYEYKTGVMPSRILTFKRGNRFTKWIGGTDLF